jgi:PAS domain S-box-containing protein
MQDTAGKLAYVNERLGQMLGYAREEMLGTAPVEYVDDESLRGWQKRMLERQVGEPQPYELYLKAKDGRKIFAKISPRLIFDSEGRYGGSFAVVTDLTERMRAEQGLRESESELRLLSAQLLTAQEQERKRIASELHDGIGQSLSAVKFSVEDALRLLAEKSAQKSARSLESVIPKIQAAIEEVRRMSMDLRPSTLDDLGIIPTLAWFFRQFEAIYDDIRVVKKIDIQENDVPVPLKTTIFRIMQEAMNNVAKHGKAGMASVTLRRLGDTLEMLIQDDGQGFSVEEVSVRESQHRGFGLASMRERAEFSGGSYSISSAKGDGTRIRVAWPCCGVRQVSAA